MKVYRRPPSPYWWGDVTIDGKRVRFSTERTVKKEAEAVVASRLKTSLDRRQFGVLPEETLTDAIEAALRDMAGSADYRNAVSRAHKLQGVAGFKGRWGINYATPLSKIDTALVERLHKERHLEGNSRGTINLEVAFLQRVVNLARKRGVGRRPPGTQPRPTPDRGPGHLGHSSPKMTQKYAHLAPGSAADEAALVLDAIRAQIRAA